MGGIVVWLAFRRPFRVVVQGVSMAPTLRPGDFLIAVRPASIRRGDLGVVVHPDRPGYEMVKRFAGVPGDSIEGVTLGADQFWMVGDNPEASTDSRTLGPFDRASIRGIVRFRYWPLAHLSILIPAAVETQVSSTRHRR
jgi:nickel-type superoxide dismutase maturation protease